jgi:hypothetical protein
VNDFTGNKKLLGYIGLQNYSVGGMQFRAIRIKKLPPSAQPPGA